MTDSIMNSTIPALPFPQVIYFSTVNMTSSRQLYIPLLPRLCVYTSFLVPHGRGDPIICSILYRSI